MSQTLLTALMCAALGLAWANAPVARAAVGGAIALATALLVSGIQRPVWAETAASGASLLIILACGAAVLAPFERSRSFLYASAFAGGMTAGLAMDWTAPFAPLTAAAGLLVFAPGQFLLKRQMSIVLKVTASWLIACALLNMAAVAAPAPPPPAPADHME